MPLAAVAAVSEVAGDGLALCLCGGGGVAGVHFDVGEVSPSKPNGTCVTESFLALDRQANFVPRFVQAAEFTKTDG